MGWRMGVVRVFIDEGEAGLPGGGSPGVPTHPIYNPPYPDQGLPPQQPGIDNSLPGQPARPDQGLPPYPDQGLPGQPARPDQGLPETPEPKGATVYDVPPEPTAPPSGEGEWVIAIMDDEAVWVFLPSDSSGGAPVAPDQGLPPGSPGAPAAPDHTLPGAGTAGP